MKIEDKIRNEKLQYNINGEATKSSALYVMKYLYLTGQGILYSIKTE